MIQFIFCSSFQMMRIKCKQPSWHKTDIRKHVTAHMSDEFNVSIEGQMRAKCIGLNAFD
jgi:hypothetical protein